jgi:hypothetical protein
MEEKNLQNAQLCLNRSNQNAKQGGLTSVTTQTATITGHSSSVASGSDADV